VKGRPPRGPKTAAEGGRRSTSYAKDIAMKHRMMLYLLVLVAAVQAGAQELDKVLLDGVKDYWAFVSITHNTTQHVTLITPQP
jgi:hypothetical protein